MVFALGLGVLPVARAAAGSWGPFTAAVWVAALALPWGYVAWLQMAAGAATPSR